jgi:hypothetical protein
MPRLSNDQYLFRHDFLYRLWTDERLLFRLLTPTQQRNLHRYYLPAMEVSDDHLLAHRRQLDRDQPSLGIRAGKSFALLQQDFNGACDTYGLDAVIAGCAIPAFMSQRKVESGRMTLRKGCNGPRQVSVSSLMLPEPDIDLLAKALLRLAEQLAVQQEADPDQSQSEAA